MEKYGIYGLENSFKKMTSSHLKLINKFNATTI